MSYLFKLQQYLKYTLVFLILVRVSLFDMWQSVKISVFGIGLNPAGIAGIALSVVGIFALLKTRKWHNERLFTVLLLFFFVNCVLTLQSNHIFTSLEELIRILNYVMLYWLGYEFFSNKKDVRAILITYGLAGLMISAISLMQYLRLGGNFETIDFPNRLQGPFPHPNILAFTIAFIAMLLAGIIIFLKKKQQSRDSRYQTIKQHTMLILALVAFAGGVITLLFTYTRGAWLAFTVASIIFCFILMRQTAVKTILITLLAIIAFHTGSVALFNTSPLHRFADIAPIKRVLLTPKDEDYTISGRFDLWRYGFIVFLQDPITGYGLGNFHRAVSFYLRLPPDEGLNPHNDFIRFLVESGMIGFGLFVWLIIEWFTKAMTIFKKNTEHKIITTTVLCSGIVFFLGTVTDNLFRFTALLWMFWFLSGAYFGWFSKILENKKNAKV